jgi:hypothetical protein
VSPDAESPSIVRSIDSSLDGESLVDDLQYKSSHFSNSFHSVLTLAADCGFRHSDTTIVHLPNLESSGKQVLWG